MDNRSIAQLLADTADLLEISAGDPFRIRSYRRAAEAVESSTIQLSTIANDPKKLQEIPGIGKGMAANIQAIESAGTLPLREELLLKYRPTMLELLRLPGMGPKTVALLWDALQVASVEDLEKAIAEGRLAGLPRFGEKLIEKLRKGIADYKERSGRFLIDDAEEAAEKLIAYLKEFPGIETILPAGSLRRGRDTVGDLDILATGPACAEDCVGAAVEYAANYPPANTMLAKGQNKVSFRLRSGSAGGCAAAAGGIVWGGAAVLHGIEDAQRVGAAAGAEARLHAERVCAGEGGGWGVCGGRDRGGDLRGAGAGLDSAGAAGEQRRD